jgi:hypothetical protein
MILEAETVSRETVSGGQAALGKPIIILGMSRSGTSLIGDMVHRWGAYGGDPASLTAGNVGNPNGYFEHRKMQRFLLTQLGLDFWSPDYPERLRGRARDPECRQKALELIAEMAGRGPAWFWKEPALSVMLPFWKEIWGDAVYVIPVRDPYDSAVSYQKFSIPGELRDRVRIVCANLLEWQYSMRCILEELRDVPNKIFVPYESLVASPQEEGRRLRDFLDQHRGGAGPVPDRFERMVAAVDSQLHHNSGKVDFSSRPDVTQAQKDLYRFLRAEVDGLALPFNPADYPMYEGWREYLANILFFRRFAADVTPLLRSRWVAVGSFLSRGLSRFTGAFRRSET